MPRSTRSPTNTMFRRSRMHAKEKFGASIAAGWSLDDYPLAATVVYESTPSEDRALRDLVVDTSRENIDKLLTHDGFCGLLRKSADFGADLIPFLCDKLSTEVQRFECPSCHHYFYGNFLKGNDHCPNCSSRRSDWRSYRTCQAMVALPTQLCIYHSDD